MQGTIDAPMQRSQLDAICGIEGAIENLKQVVLGSRLRGVGFTPTVALR